MKQVTLYSIVIPVYGRGEHLSALIARIDTVMDEMNASWEVILVEDCSPWPEAWSVSSALAEEIPQVTAYRLMQNTNKIGALLCGMAQAIGKYILLMDDDGQHAPEDIPLLAAQRDHDLVIADLQGKQQTFSRRLLGGLKRKLDTYIIGKPKGLAFSPFMLIKHTVVDALLQVQMTKPYLPALLFGITKDAVNVAVRQQPRTAGESGFTLWRMLVLVSTLLIGVSGLLLRIVSIVGVVSFLTSIVLAAYWIWKKLSIGINVPGWTSLMVVLLLIGGLVLFALGIIGEYLLRILRTQEKRPPYIIAATIT